MNETLNNAETPPCFIHGVTSSVFCSDNLELMKTIESNTIDLIYCDILYGTGRKFADFQDLKPIRSDIESHYIPRIKEMHRILKPTGSIYLQMDTKINHWIRCIMDDIFGYDRMLNEIVWCYKSNSKVSNRFSSKHDIILFYSKSNNNTFNPIKSEWDRAERIKQLRQKIHTDETGEYFWDNRYQSNGVPKFKHYIKDLMENGAIYQNDVFIDICFLNGSSKERNGYDTQKPKELIEKFIKASSNEGDLVADFYMGSGTTAEVCKELNRNFIGCDINPRAVEITIQRLNDARS